MPVRRLDDYLRRASEAVRSPVELEAVLRRLAELVVEEAAKRAGSGCDVQVFEALKSIEERIRALEERVNEVKMLVNELSRTIRSLDQRSAGRERSADRMPRWLSSLLKALDEEGFKLASQLPRDVVDGFDKVLAERYGIYTLDIGGDIVFAKREVLEELTRTVSAVNVADEAAVAAKLGGRLSRLFMLLRKGGYLVYSASRKGWVPVDELKKIVKG